MPARSYLFVPGDRPGVLAKVAFRGADAVIADLEDSVAPAGKGKARSTIVGWLASQESPGYQRWVRVNRGSLFDEDLATLEGGTLDGIVIPKVDGPEDVVETVQRLLRVQPTANLIVLIETAKALRSLDNIASVDGVFQLMLGEADLGADIGMAADDPGWNVLRVAVIVASAAALLEPPVAPVDPDISNQVQFKAETERMRRMGFGSRAVIHPLQVNIVNTVFTPNQSEIDAAYRLIADHTAAQSSGKGVYLDDRGRMVDEAIVRRARRILKAVERGDQE